MTKVQLILFCSIILISSSWLFVDIKADTQMEPAPPLPRPHPYWGFDVNTTIGWRATILEGSGPRVRDLIYNISEIKLIEDGLAFDTNKFDAYGIVLDRLFWNANLSTPGLEPLRNVLPNYPLINVSLVNYTDVYPLPLMFPLNPEGPEEGRQIEVNPFIPINGTTNKPDMVYCAELLYPYYNHTLSNGTASTTDVYTKTDGSTYWNINYTNTDMDTYANMTYDINGILIFGEIHVYHGSEKAKIRYERISDFNPLNDTQWALNVGDLLYLGRDYVELRSEIMKINETTIIQENEPLTYQEVWANITYWDGSEHKWQQEDFIPIGRANDNDPMTIIENQGPSFFLLPKGTRGYDVENHWQDYADNSPYVDAVDTGENYIKIYNTINNSYVYLEYFSNGVLKYLHKYSVADFMEPEDIVIFYKNSTVINGRNNEFVINPFGAEGDFQIKIICDVRQDTHVLFAGFHYLPIENELNNALVYLDIWMNDSTNMILLNITISCTNNYDELKLQKLQFGGPSPVWIDISYNSTANRANTSETSATFYNTIYGLSETQEGEEEISINWEIAFSRAFARAFEQAFARAFSRAFARALERAYEQQ